jgi:hypothetical protein
MPPVNAPLPGDDADDVIEEFFPEQAKIAHNVVVPPRPTREQFDSETGEVTSEPEPLIDVGQSMAKRGSTALKDWWSDELTKVERQRLVEHLAGWKQTAMAVDDAKPATTDVEIFEVIDHLGELAYAVNDANEAVNACLKAMDDGIRLRGVDGLVAVWENNGGLMNALERAGHEDLSVGLGQDYAEKREACERDIPFDDEVVHNGTSQTTA